MEPASQLLHEVAVTAIVVKDGKYLITQRTLAKKRFPGKWTVPGGRLETSDYINLPKDTEECWYNVLERVVRREVKEEVGLEIKNIEYVTSLATRDNEGTPLLVISCMADWESGEVILQKSETDRYAWISTDETNEYDLIGGIDEELRMVDARRRGNRLEWKK
ncbi:MAG TPA: NUDIX domain-containing protein [Candidatus Paceibacterota bacterium]|nr:NUDIX domain-containing protein [Candidatus Paceibacterota bacterium]